MLTAYAVFLVRLLFGVCALEQIQQPACTLLLSTRTQGHSVGSGLLIIRHGRLALRLTGRTGRGEARHEVRCDSDTQFPSTSSSTATKCQSTTRGRSMRHTRALSLERATGGHLKVNSLPVRQTP